MQLRGHGDALTIGYQDRPDIFARRVRRPQPLAAAVIEVDERVAADGAVLVPLGETLMTRGRYVAADSTFRRAVAEHAADSLTAKLNLALLMKRRGDAAAAHAAFDGFIDVYNTAASSLTSRDMLAVAIACRELGAGNPALFRDALRALDRVAIDSELRPEADQLRVEIQRLLLAADAGQASPSGRLH